MEFEQALVDLDFLIFVVRFHIFAFIAVLVIRIFKFLFVIITAVVKLGNLSLARQSLLKLLVRSLSQLERILVDFSFRLELLSEFGHLGLERPLALHKIV